MIMIMMVASRLMSSDNSLQSKARWRDPSDAYPSQAAAYFISILLISFFPLDQGKNRIKAYQAIVFHVCLFSFKEYNLRV